MSPPRRDGADEAPEPDALQQILELERSLDALRREHELEAERVLREAAEQARQRQAGSSRRQEEALARLRHQIETQRDASLARIEAEAEAESTRYREVTGLRMEALADWLVQQVIQGGPRIDDQITEPSTSEGDRAPEDAG